MRHPRSFKFLAWAGPTFVVLIAGLVGLIAALAPTYPGVKKWGEDWFNLLTPIVTASWFIAGVVLVLLAYVIALVWTSQPVAETKVDAPAPIAPLLFAGFVEANNTPQNGYSAIRVQVRNQSNANLGGLVARLVQAEPPLAGLEGDIQLPLVLETKGRLDRFRNPAIQEQFPQQGFDLHAHSEKQVEVLWLHSQGALEGYITHEAGQGSFIFVGSQELRVEVTGAGPPIAATVRINVADDDVQSWTVTLIPEAVGLAVGQG